jgi:hypothetical protein
MNFPQKNIVFVSGHYPSKTYFAIKTRATFAKYTAKHGYGFYYDEADAIRTEDADMRSLHYRRCVSIQKAAAEYPAAKWFVWVDSDVYVNNYSVKVEDVIDLTDYSILYHLFHEDGGWGQFPINTGVKFVNREAIEWERVVWELRNTDPWTQYPFEQKTIYEYVLPCIGSERYRIHDPYLLNCITKAYPEKVERSVFAHMCACTEEERNLIMRNVYI